MILTEKTIDQVLDKMETSSEYQRELQEAFSSKYEDYLVYLEKEIFSILNEKEADLLLFIHLVIFEAARLAKVDQDAFELHAFFDIEDGLWAAYEDRIKLPFAERITPVFDQVDEEDALAFIEDLLVLPEEDESEEIEISNSGRDVIWNVGAGFVQIMLSIE